MSTEISPGASPTVTPEKRAIQLKWDGGKVVVTPEDQDRFLKEASWAVSACQNQLAVDRYIDQFKTQFLKRLRFWCVQHKDQVIGCYVVPPITAGMKVFVISSSKQYDFSLSDPLTDLESELDEISWPTDILQIPDSSTERMNSFFEKTRSIQVYGD